MAQSSKDAQKANTTKATNSTKTIAIDPKKNPADSRSSNPKSSAENSRSDKASASTQTIPEKIIKDSRNQETQTEDKRKTQAKGKTAETQEKSTQLTISKYELL